MYKPPKILHATPKPRGAGDATDRVPVPSSRKFTPTSIRDPSLQLKLKKTLILTGGKPPGMLRKARTVAEITPTKSKPSCKRSKRDDGASRETLHATPRPLAGGTKAASGRRRDEEVLAAGRLIYQRLLLNTWRRTRARLATLSESSRRQRDQIGQLELEVEVLKSLCQSECDNRDQAMNDQQKMQEELDLVRSEKRSLYEEKLQLEENLTQMEQSINRLKVDNENAKNDSDTKQGRLENLCHQLRLQELKMSKMEEENASLTVKLTNLENTIKLHETTIEDFEQKLSIAEEKGRKSEEVKRKLDDLSRTYHNEKTKIVKAKLDLEFKIQELECTLRKLNDKLFIVQKEYDICKMELEEQRNGWRTKVIDFLQISWSVVQRAIYLTLPTL